MQVGESNLKTLIEGQKQFQVPLFQRQYAWDTPQLRQLWADVLEQYDLLTPDPAGHVAPPAPTHFLGSMVLAPSPMIQAQGVTPFLVIDGQQRLTTLFIALCALRDHAAPADLSAATRFNELYLTNKFGTGLSFYRLLPTQTDRDAFFACIGSESSTRTGAMGRAYSFFRAQLTQPGPDDLPLDVLRLETVLCQRLHFVAITADQRDNVHRIFESLNDRGVRLTQADLLRNYLFMLLPNKAEDVYEHVWRPMQESLSPSQLETLVFVDLILRGKVSIKREDIYRAQQDRLEPLEADEAAIVDEIRELARQAKFFKRIVQPETEPGGLVRAGLERLNRWGASTAFPVLMHLFRAWDSGSCSRDEVVSALGYIESFLVRRMIAGVPTNNLNRIFNALLEQLPGDRPIDQAVQYALSTERKYWPSDQRLREAFHKQSFYFQGRQDQKMVVFERLEESYPREVPLAWSGAHLSIEHVMPQTLSDEWRSDLGVGGEDPDALHAELLHTLGNLTVTAHNGALSNKPYERKKAILEGSDLKLNQAIIPENQWGRAEITARADELATRAISIWPGPLPGVSEPSAGRDWTRLDGALAALPHGAWTTYGDLAELISSHQVPVGQRIATGHVLNGHRVLNADGRVAAGFYWADPADTRDVLEVLKDEGVRFGEDGRADPSQRLHADELAALLGDVIEPLSSDGDEDSGWRLQRSLRYLSHFYEAPGGRLDEESAKRRAIEEGYDPRGVAGYYQGTASLRRDGAYRVLTDAGREWFEEHRHLMNLAE